MTADGVFDAPIEELDGTVVTTMEDVRRFYRRSRPGASGSSGNRRFP
jgi:hypothetical protein